MFDATATGGGGVRRTASPLPLVRLHATLKSGSFSYRVDSIGLINRGPIVPESRLSYDSRWADGSALSSSKRSVNFRRFEPVESPSMSPIDISHSSVPP